MTLPVKTELFDVDVLQKLVMKDGITQKDKADLQRYRRRRINGNQIMIQYDFGKAWKKASMGRLYPSPCVGLAMFPKDIRAALAQKYYWDIDIENAQPVMLVTAAKKYKVSCSALEEYCLNRESILEEIKQTQTMNRDEAKTLCISVLFGGFRDQHPLLPRIYNELRELSQTIALEFPKLIKLAKEKDSSNPYATCLSVYIQNEERLVLEKIDDYFTKKGRSFDVLIFDGGLLRKHDNELSVPNALLREVEAHVLETTGYSIHLVNKPLTHTFDFGIKEIVYPSTIVLDDRFACKKFVELNPDTFLRDGNDCFLVNPSSGLWEPLQFSIFNEILASCSSEMVFKQEAANGIRTINYGGQLKNIKNMFEFLNVCVPKGEVPIQFLGSLESSPDNSASILTSYMELIDLISNHEKEKSEYLLNYLAHSVQKPRHLPGVCLVVTGEQGCGKDTTFDIFMNYVIGKNYATNMKNEDFFSPYDTLKTRKVFVKLEEANSELCRKNKDMLKNLITGTRLSVNPKHKEPYEIQNYTRFVFTSNYGNPIDFEGSDRRFILYDCSLEKVGNSEYWKQIHETLYTEEAGHVLYEWFMKRNISEFNPIVFPISAYQQEVQQEYKTIERKFLDEWDGEEINADDLHRDFCSFCRRLKLKEDDIPNKISFGKRLLRYIRDKTIIKQRRNDGVYYSRQ